MKYNELIKDLEKVKYHLTATDHKAVIYDAIDALQSQNAEIERLQTETRILSQKRINFFALFSVFFKIGVKAFEEFAERLKDETFKINYCGSVYNVVDIDDIDNLAKEMTAEESGNAES